VALVSDAGTPGISDPGAKLVGEARRQGVRVEAVPGPSAVMAALSIAGVPGDVFTFLGFPPIRAKDRKRWFRRLESAQDTTVLMFEAPHRISSTLYELTNYVKCPIVVCRELTKLHEEVLTGSPAGLASRLADARGEFTVVIPPRSRVSPSATQTDPAQVREFIGRITKICAARSKREMARLVAQEMGVPTRSVYEMLDGDTDDSKPG
jgi:16S rRNA (cytidine1402-2'-O)-methyltransferase